MRFGQRYSAPLGEPSKTLQYLHVETKGNLLYVEFYPRVGYGNRWFGIYLNAIKQTHIYVPEGRPTTLNLTPQYGDVKISVLCLNIGYQGDPNYDAQAVARTYESNYSRRATLELVFVPEIYYSVNPDFNFTSLTGYTYGVNCSVDSTTRNICYLDYVYDATSTILSVYNGNVLVATSTGTGAVTLNEVNSSGLSGTVTVDAAAVDTTSRLYLRWPEYVQVLRGLTNPPTVVVKSIQFNGVENRTWSEPEDLVAGDYYYALRSRNNTEYSNLTTPILVSIDQPPAAPTNVAYVSGNYANCVIGYTSAANVQAYIQDVGDPIIDFETPAVTTPVTDGLQLPILGVGGSGTFNFPGVVRVVLRASSDGGEEKNLNVLELEFDADGNYVEPRPNVCHIDVRRSVINGQNVNLVVTQSSDNEVVVPTGFEVFVREDGSSYDVTSPLDGTFTRKRNGVRYGTIDVPLGTGTLYHIVVYAVVVGTDSEVASESSDEYDFYLKAGATLPTFEIHRSNG